MPDLAAIRAETSGGDDCTYRSDPHPKVYFGQVHLWMVHFGVHPPRRGALGDTQRNLGPPAEGLSEVHKEIWDLFFF